MNKVWLAVVMLVSMLAPAAVCAQAVTWCEKGSICWIDRSQGTASTDIRVRAEGGELSLAVGPGVNHVRLADAVRASSLLPSDWICAQARHRYPDGTLSPWFISDNEGVCSQTAKVLPPEPATPPPPSPVLPPPVSPPDPVSVEIFSELTNSNGLLSFFYKVLNCPRGVQQTTSAEKDGQKRITLKCRR